MSPLRLKSKGMIRVITIIGAFSAFILLSLLARSLTIVDNDNNKVSSFDNFYIKNEIQASTLKNWTSLASSNASYVGSAIYDGSSFSIDTGDVNGDGFADVLIGAPYEDAGGTDIGMVYIIIFGSNSSW
ncbi:MAG: FG-GAP repeat protein [Promethearchaeota archaeon]